MLLHIKKALRPIWGRKTSAFRGTTRIRAARRALIAHNGGDPSGPTALFRRKLAGESPSARLRMDRSTPSSLGQTFQAPDSPFIAVYRKILSQIRGGRNGELQKSSLFRGFERRTAILPSLHSRLRIQ